MMEEFFREGTIPIHDLIPGPQGHRRRKNLPVLMVSGAPQYRTASLLTFLTDVSRIPMSMRRSDLSSRTAMGDRVERKV